jgi:hypothetical protein
MLCAPPLKLEVLNEAMPLLLTGAWARTLAPSWKVTIPCGVPEPGGADATVAVNVTACPPFDGFGAEVSVVVDALA